MQNKILVVLIGLLLVVVFFLGAAWTQIKNLEQGRTQTNNQASLTPTSVQKVNVPISPDDPIKGNLEAKVTIVEFSDFQCPFCGRVEPTLKQIFQTYGDQVRLVYKHYPLPSHQYAQGAAQASLCAKEQGKFWEYHDLLFENQEKLTVSDLKKYAQELGLKQDQFNSCLDSKKYQSQIGADLRAGQAAGVSGTPAFFINGQLVSGAQPFENFKAVIDQELKT